MENVDAIVILSTPKRKNEGFSLAKIVQQAEGIDDVPVLVSVDEWQNIWANFKKALRLEGGRGGKWRIILHDDMSFGRNSYKKINYVLNFMPDKSISFFNPNNRLFDDAIEKGHHVMETPNAFWMNSIAMLKSEIEDVISWADSMYRLDYTIEDTRYFHYLETFEKTAFVILPSLIQHLGYNRSSVGIPGICGTRPRMAMNYTPDFDVYNVDWEKEIKNRIYKKHYYNYLKSVGKWLLKK